MIIYRVENEQGDGPYQAASIGWAKGNHDALDGHPIPLHDKSGEPYSVRPDHDDGPFGFTTLAQLHAWFEPAELDALAREGFAIREFHSRPERLVWASQKQCIFEKDYSLPTVPRNRRLEFKPAPAAARN